jgi:hypothetical protein
MAYVIEIADALSRVLERAASLPPHRVAGYSANSAFWLSEVRHCLDAIAGHEDRFRRMRSATNTYVAAHPLAAHRKDSDTRTTRGTKDFELDAAKDALTAAARKFFHRCDALDLLAGDLRSEVDAVINLEQSA